MPPKPRQPLTDRSNMSLAVEPATVNPARLKYDYGQIDEAHRERVQFATIAIQDYMSRAAESVIGAGRELLEVRDVLPHGQFVSWAETEFGVSERMAQHMMNAAREYGSNPKRVTGFSPSVVYVLAAPSTPEAARQEVETTAQETGTPPTRKEVKRVINKHKPPEPKPARVVYAEAPALPVQPSPPPATPVTSEPTELPDGYTLRQTPRGWRWRRELTNDTVLMGDYCETEAGAAESARRDWEARQARQAARTVYVEPQGQPTAEPEQPTERYIVTLAAEHYHALRAAILAGALRLSTDRATVEAIKQAFEEAERAQ